MDHHVSGADDSSAESCDTWAATGLRDLFGISAAKFMLLLAVLVLAAFPDVVLGSRTFFYRDFALFGYPLAHHQRASFWQGEIPLWNPFNNSGMPFAAQWNTMVFYPLAFFYFLFPLPWALPMFCLLHLLLGGAGMFYLTRRWTEHSLAACIAGVLFAFNGLMFSCLKWPNNIAALAWMPWVILLAERGWRQGGRCLAIAALAGAVQMFSGGPEIILFTWMIAGALWILDAIGALRYRQPAVLWRLPFLILLVAGASAIQLFPFFQLLAHSQRSDLFADASWSMPAWGPANFIVPLFRTFPSHHGVHVQPGQFWIASYYIGPLAIALAITAIARVRCGRTVLLAGITILSVWLALGPSAWLYDWLASWVPGFQIVRFPIKFVVPVLMCVPLLAGIGLASLLQRNEAAHASGNGRGDIVPLLTVAVVITLAMAGLVVLDLSSPSQATGMTNAIVLNTAIRLVLLIAAIVVIWRLLQMPASRSTPFPPATGHRQFNRYGSILLLAIISIDLLTHAPRLNPTVEPWVYEPNLARSELKWAPSPAGGESRAMISPWADHRLNHLALTNAADDVVYSRLAQFANLNLLDRVPKVDGFFSLAINEESRVRYLLYGSTNANVPELERFLGVSQKTAPGELIEWSSRTNFLPFVSAGQEPVFADGPAALRSMAEAQFRPAEVVFLDPAIASATTAKRRVHATARITDFQAHRITIEVTAEEPAWVVIAQAHYPPWRALIGDREIPIRHANHAFQAIEVPAGQSVVRLVYRDRWFQIGAASSGVMFLGCLFLLRTRRSRNPRTANSPTE